MPLRYQEQIGTILNDNITGGSRTITFGNYGDDVLSTAAGSDEAILIGGGGSDVYNVGTGSSTTIADTTSGTAGPGLDRINIPGMSAATTVAGIIDGQHLVAVDTQTLTQVILLDWLDPVNAIEVIQLSDAAFSTTELASLLTSLPGYVGDFPWESTGTIPPGFTAADVREAIAFYTTRARQVDASNDGIEGGSGSDTYFGYEGNDTLSGGGGHDFLQGNQGNDQLFGGDGRDTLLGGKDSDFLQGNTGTDDLNGNDGNDTVWGGRDNDTVRGGKNDDQVNGNNADDVVFGDLGNDTLNGGQDQDRLFGGEGDDFLSGDKGNDTLAGGGGADLFFFTTESGLDTIEDFQTGSDRIALSTSLGVTVEQVLQAAVYNGGSATLAIGEGNVVTLLGIAGSLSQADFTVV